MDAVVVNALAGYRGRRVLVTGHTGFKGGWLAEWLLALGADVIGVALAAEHGDGVYACLGLSERLSERLLDIRDADALARVVREERPEIVFHLAAQPLVRRSYDDPVTTWQTNVIGTINVMESLRRAPDARAAVLVTTDKCYENREWHWGYREIDPLGGHDPYSASKAAAEIAIASHRRSYFSSAGPAIASARAGNVIGGGDRAADRIVTDFIASARAGRPLRLRNPLATRPWQHVLEPLYGYLLLGARLLGDDGRSFAEAWNFGPSDAGIASVGEVAGKLAAAWGDVRVEVDDGARPHEARLLALDCAKAAARLGWRGALSLDEAVSLTVEWYRAQDAGADLRAMTRRQIAFYEDRVARRSPTTGVGKKGAA